MSISNESLNNFCMRVADKQLYSFKGKVSELSSFDYAYRQGSMDTARKLLKSIEKQGDAQALVLILDLLSEEYEA